MPRRWAWAALAAVLAPSAAADPGLSVRADARLIHDDNLFRLPDQADAAALVGDSRRSDLLRLLSVSAAAEIAPGRQRLRATATLDQTRYQHYRFNDFDGHDLGLAYIWQYGNHWSGDAALRRSQAATSFADSRQPRQNVQTVSQSWASARWTGAGPWRFTGRVQSTEARNGGVGLASADATDDSAEFGVEWVSRAGTVLKVGQGQSESRRPNPEAVGDRVVRNDATQTETRLELDWRPSGALRLDARAARATRRHADLPERDFSGATGRATLDWLATGHLSARVAIYRELGAHQDLSSNFILTTGASLGLVWAPTVKLSARIDLDSRQRDFQGDPGLVLGGVPRRRDEIGSVSLSLAWQPLRRLTLSASLRDEARESSDPDFQYRARALSLGASLSVD